MNIKSILRRLRGSSQRTFSSASICHQKRRKNDWAALCIYIPYESRRDRKKKRPSQKALLADGILTHKFSLERIFLAYSPTLLSFLSSPPQLPIRLSLFIYFSGFSICLGLCGHGCISSSFSALFADSVSRFPGYCCCSALFLGCAALQYSKRTNEFGFPMPIQSVLHATAVYKNHRRTKD